MIKQSTKISASVEQRRAKHGRCRKGVGIKWKGMIDMNIASSRQALKEVSVWTYAMAWYEKQLQEVCHKGLLMMK